ncbi:PilZ domain-containing protein [Amorphus sp. 3PC139-8]|uniref:PilZ domain-containing protein n=1 Tax=Amorphus sp. 3PC139-8 TaxID=2735676 RepID=UPI00345C6F1E
MDDGQTRGGGAATRAGMLGSLFGRRVERNASGGVDRSTDDFSVAGGQDTQHLTAAAVSASLAARRGGAGPSPQAAVPRKETGTGWGVGEPRASDVDGRSRRLASRLETRARFDTGGQSYETLDWSIGGFALAAAKTGFSKGQTFGGTFTLFLDQFVISTSVQAEVVHVDPHRIGFRFTELSPSQLRMLRTLAAALLSGRAPTALPVGEAPSDGPRKTKAKSDRRPASRMIRLVSGTFNAILALVVVTIGLFVFFAPIEPVFTAETGAVAAPRIVVAAPFTGSLDEIVAVEDATVEAGDPLAHVTSIDGVRQMLESPCNCMVVRYTAALGELVPSGAPMVDLVDREETPVIEALFDFNQAEAWQPGRLVEITLIYSGATFGGRIERVSPTAPSDVIGIPPGLAASSDKQVAWIKPDRALPLTDVGEPARVRFQQSTGL